MANVIAPGEGVPGWRGRMREAAYTSPSGTRFLYEFEDVSVSIPLRNTPFEFPGVQGAYVQQNGFGSDRYPMRFFLSGSNHDLLAREFVRALLEPGRGRLEHPMYGVVQNVVPMGSVERRDDLKTRANQSVIEVELWSTLIDLYPSSQTRPESEVTAALSDFDVAAAQQFADLTDLSTAVERANMASTMTELLGGISGALSGVSDATASIRQGFGEAQKVINEGMSVFVGQPLLLARQICDLVKFPARAAAGIRARMDGYRALAQDIFASEKGSPGTALESGVALAIRSRLIANAFHASDLVALNAVGGAVSSTVNHNFTTRPEALSTAAEVIEQFDAAVAWRDLGFGALEQIPRAANQQLDTGGSYDTLRKAVAFCAGHLTEISFSLLPERAIRLDRNRTLIDLAGELYGSVSDETLNDLIRHNNLGRDRILELRKGDRIVYYSEAA